MSTISIPKEVLQGLRETLVAAQTSLTKKAAATQEATKVTDQAKANVRAQAKVAADLLLHSGNLSKEAHDGWLARVTGPDGHEASLEAISLLVKSGNEMESRKLGKGRGAVREKQASATDRAAAIDLKYARSLGFSV